MDYALEYKDCVGSVEYSEDDRLYWGKLLGIPDSISYQGDDMDELRLDFEEAVEDYFAVCEEIGKTPIRPLAEALDVSIAPDLRKELVVVSAKREMPLNNVIDDALRRYVNEARQAV